MAAAAAAAAAVVAAAEKRRGEARRGRRLSLRVCGKMQMKASYGDVSRGSIEWREVCLCGACPWAGQGSSRKEANGETQRRQSKHSFK
jgi:hypothetical protein